MLVGSSELPTQFQPIVIAILVLILILTFIWIYAKNFQNRVQHNSISRRRRRNNEKLQGSNSNDIILPKYVEHGTQDNVSELPSYAIMSDFSHIVNNSQRIETCDIQSEDEYSSGNCDSSVHYESTNQIR